MAKNLVIVESPAKAKTIEGYLGKEFLVKSSFGHVRDLAKGDNAVDVKNGYTPLYEISDDKIKTVKELRDEAGKSEVVWLATDDDREGEAISWHLKEALELNDNKIKRIVFREITKNAILKAIESPRGIDIDLVNAQQARRILDRLVGYEISPVLWKKIKAGLSAGRVQSVAVRLVVEREREIEKFAVTSAFKVVGYFITKDGKVFPAELSERFETAEQAKDYLEKCIGANFSVKNLEVKPGKKSPAPPFTTSTLQQEASRKLSFSVSQTMTLAQRLYESGKITYMRTDSVNLSESAIAAAENEIISEYGKEYAHSRRYKTKSESAQEAHEAIRPTDFGMRQASEDRNEQRLYELIFKRTMASQMADAQIEKTVATIENSKDARMLQAVGEVVKFDGFLKVYQESNDNEDEESESRMLPNMSIGQSLGLDKMKATQKFTRPLPRYTEASLVKKLEEMGIGRPSTYAPTISTIEKRQYVAKETREGKLRNYEELVLKGSEITQNTLQETIGAEKAKLFPTDMGTIVNDFLVNHFPNVVDFQFTATVEKEFDDIARGQKAWETMIDSFYTKFHETVENSANVERSTVSTTRLIGSHPETGSKIFARLGKFGPVVQIGDAEAGEKPVYASLKKNQRIDSVTIEEVLELFRLPREVGVFEDQPLVVNNGKFGPYVKSGSKFFSIPKELDPYTITEAEAIDLIVKKRKDEVEKVIKEFPENADVKVLNGRFGPYIVIGKKNVKIPKDKVPADLTLAECIELGDATPDKKPGGRKFPPKKN